MKNYKLIISNFLLAIIEMWVFCVIWDFHIVVHDDQNLLGYDITLIATN